MKLATRMKITYAMVFFVPIILITVTFLCMGRVEQNALKQKYDMENVSIEMLFDPFEMLGNMSTSMISELQHTSEKNPEKLEDMDYLEKMNEQMNRYSS